MACRRSVPGHASLYALPPATLPQIFNDTEFPALPKKSYRNGLFMEKPDKVASLLSLPDELILHILDHLPCFAHGNGHLVENLNLSLTNRRLYALVSERLYAGYHGFFGPYHFLRTVVSSPALAKRVQSVDFTYGAEVQFSQSKQPPSVSDKRVIKEGLKRLAIRKYKTWAGICNEAKDRETLFATILMHTPNVASLDIKDGPLPYRIPKWVDLVRWTVSGSPFGHMYQFSRLKSIQIDTPLLKLRHVAPLFRIKTLRKLKLVNLVDVGQTKEATADNLQKLVPPCSSSIEDLALVGCFVYVQLLGVLFKSIRALQRFEYRYTDVNYSCNGDGEDYWAGTQTILTPNRVPPAMLHYTSLASFLEAHCHSLESLALSEDVIEHGNSQSPVGVLGDLRRFKKITYLDAPLSALVGTLHGTQTVLIKVLPPCLTLLCISVRMGDCNQRFTTELEHMADNCQTLTPSLREIQILSHDFLSLRPFDRPRLLKLFVDEGVSFVVKQLPYLEGA